MKNYFNSSNATNNSLVVLHNNPLETDLDKAKDFEKSHKWIEAADFYHKAFSSAVKDKNFLKAFKIQEKISYCYNRATLQADTQKSRIQAILTFKQHLDLLLKCNWKNRQVLIKHTKASIAFYQSWLETNPKTKKELLDECFNLEKEVLHAVEKIGDPHLVGRICSNLLEYNQSRLWLASEWTEHEKIIRSGFPLADKAIFVLSKHGTDHEQATAYNLATWYYSWSERLGVSKEEKRQLNKKFQEYSKKALELSERTGEASLIGRAYFGTYNEAYFMKVNPALGLKYGQKIKECGKISKDKFLISCGNIFSSKSLLLLAPLLEDPEKQKATIEKAIKLSQEAIQYIKTEKQPVGISLAYSAYARAQVQRAAIETNHKTKQSILESSRKVILEGIEQLKPWKMLSGNLFLNLSRNQHLLAETKTDIKEKRRLLQESKVNVNAHLSHVEKMYPFSYLQQIASNYQLALVLQDLAKVTINKKSKIEFLISSISSLSKYAELMKKYREKLETSYGLGISGRYYAKLGETLQKLSTLRKDKKTFLRAIEAFNNASDAFQKANLATYAAESLWHISQIYDQLDEFQEAAKHYELASKAYSHASKNIPQLNQFYKDYAVYMKAWSQIEKARLSHSIEDYQEAQKYYEEVAKLHQITAAWNYLAPNYLAWSYMEEAECLSRKENTQRSKQTFQKAYEQFSEAKESFKQKMGEITSQDEKEMTKKLFKNSDLRRNYCQVRILMEEAKLLERDGKYLESSKIFGKAAQTIFGIVDEIDVEGERKELKYLAILCQAWGKMANAEERNSSESFLEAAELFEQAKERCFTRKASLWALGNSNFCRGLAAGVEYQTRLDVKEHNEAKGYIKNAATNYLKAGYENASEYAKATQRLFDAYLFMNQAEREVDTEKRVKKYQLAENLLQLAAGSFMKAKQPEKTAQVQQMLENVREEKKLAISFNEVLQAPAIVSATSSFMAPTSTSEVSVGLASFEHANVQVNIVTHVREVKVGESFCLSVEFVNAGREPALLMRVEDFVPPDFVVVKKPEIYRIEDTTLNMKGKQLAPLKLVEVKLTLQPSKKGDYRLNPRVVYLDELGQNKSLQLKTLEIKVEEVILGDRVSTGTIELDSLLLGGIPNEYAVALAGPPCDERELLIKNFLKAGADEGDITFYISTEVGDLEDFLAKPNFILFLCNPKPKVDVPDLTNVYKLRGKTDLTNLGIALAKACRGIGKSVAKRRVCVGILSDVLVEYGTKTAREWMSGLITDLGSKGFTLLAVINPTMHPPDQANAVLDLFDGEISLTQTEDPLECKKSIKVKKLRNQDYIKNPICLTNK